MANRLEEHQQDLAEARRRLEDVAARRKAILQEEEELARVVAGWEAIVAMDKKELGASTLPPANLPEPTDLGDPCIVDLGDAEEEEDRGENKTQFVLDVIQQRGQLGTIGRDLKRAADGAGLKYPASWPYNALQRLKKRGAIAKRKGKFYPAELIRRSESKLALVG